MSRAERVGSTSTGPPHPGTLRRLRTLVEQRAAVPSAPGFVAGAAAGITAVGLFAAAVVGVVDDWRSSGPLAAVGVVALVVAVLCLWRYRAVQRVPPSTAFLALVVGWLVLIAVSTAAYLAAGTFDRPDDAVFESFSGTTTTALSVLADPEATPRSVLFWRALTQWFGGIAGLIAVVVVFPYLGASDVERDVAAGEANRLPVLSRRSVRLMGNLAGAYLVLTASGIVLFLAAGMGPFDAVTYAATTISSGGFANHAGSFAHFDSALIEWAGIGGMVLAGANLALLFRGLRQLVALGVPRFVELQFYLGVLVLMTGVITALNVPEQGFGHETVRDATFSVVSVASTTGHHTVSWGLWPTGAQIALLAGIGIGAMSGAVGSGFRMVRLLALVAYVRRELARQLQPRAVIAVKIGRHTIDETTVSRMIGYQVTYLVVLAAGAIGLAAGGAEVLTAMSGAVSAMANVGPALGELAPGSGGALGLSAGSRLALVPLMFVGRLEIAPVLVGFGAVLSSTPAFRGRRPADRRLLSQRPTALPAVLSTDRDRDSRAGSGTDEVPR